MHAFLQQLTASPAHTFRTLQPTSSTVSYTLSTRPLPKTLLAHLSHYVGILLRIIVGLATVLFLYTKWCITFEKSTTYVLWAIGSERTGQLLGLAEAYQWRFLAPIAVVLLFLVFRRNYTGLCQSAKPIQSLFGLHIDRRISHDPPWSRHPNLHHVLYIPANLHHALYTHHKYPRHIHIRGF
jgi:hypothetical protein